jgi:general secretion pathway protein F/type IV pilus assembly protein PilC
MPLYHYKAWDNQGKKQNGVIEALTEREAKTKLRERGLMVTHFSTKTRVSRKQNLTGENLLAFTVQMSQLVNAGVPLYESLVAIEEQYSHESFHRVILSLCDQIKSGISLSTAMRMYPESFDRLYCALIAAGEASGSLGMVFERLSQLIQKQMKLKREIQTALIYPSILASFAVLVICVLLGFVVPSIEGIFSDRKLNGFTNFILGASAVFRNYWWIYIPMIAIFSGALVMKLRSEGGKLWLERMLLKIPLLKTLIVQAAIARFARTMATLQQGGLTMIDSLRMSREVLKNATLEEEMKNAEIKIIEGSSLSEQLGKSHYIPRMVPRMLAIGEDSGNTVVMLNKVADMYEGDLEKTLSRFMTLLQPAILIIMGGIIGMVMMAILLPLTDMTSMIAQ